MHAAILTPTFERHAEEAGLTDADLLQIVSELAASPLTGDLMPGTGGARKVRFAMPGRGKRGGIRTIHYYGGGDVPIFLLAIVKKGERADLSRAEKNELRQILPKLADAYRASAKARADAMKRR